MERQSYIIKFNGVSGETASLYASELRNLLLDVAFDIEVDLRRPDPRTQDFGSTLVLVLGTPAVIAIANAIGDWLKLRYSASLSIEKDGRVIAENLTSKDVLRLAEIFSPRE